MAGAVAEEVLSCIKTVQSLGGEQREINRFLNILRAYVLRAEFIGISSSI